MAVQTVFKRYEMKYMLTLEQKEEILRAMDGHMALDQYGRTTIRNLYYDTDTYLMVRRSLERPAYKEKLRIRSYARAGADSAVFVELKKKYKSVVYKRRTTLPCQEAMAWVGQERHCQKHTQICDEIDYTLAHYGTLHPAVFLSYEREAYYAGDGSDFRVTFDDTILVRQDGLSLGLEVSGTPILPAGSVLMEIKCSGGIPLWMVETLSHQRVYKTTFSKYGTAYQKVIFPALAQPSKQIIKEDAYSCLTTYSPACSTLSLPRLSM